MEIRLSNKDIELLKFLRRYSIILASDCQKIYKSKGYHFKRLKVLEKARYIKRVDRYLIKLDYKRNENIKSNGI